MIDKITNIFVTIQHELAKELSDYLSKRSMNEEVQSEIDKIYKSVFDSSVPDKLKKFSYKIEYNGYEISKNIIRFIKEK